MKINVLQILPALEVGGVERGTLEVAKGLVNKGYGSHVISAGGRLVKQLEEEGSKHKTINIGRKSFFTFILYRKIKQYIINNNINIVHVRSRMPAWVNYLAWLSTAPEQRPLLISTIHGPYSVNAYSKIMVRSEKIIAVSEYIKQYILNNYPDTNKNIINLIHRGVDNAVFSRDYTPSADWQAPWINKIKPETKIITIIGRITRWKGQADFIEIINTLIQSGQKVHGVIVGSAEKRRQNYMNELLLRVKQLGINEHISFLGQRNDVRELMKSSDMVLSLAKIPEAFGRTALEALCLNVPVVAYNHGGAHEVLSAMFPEGLCPANDIKTATRTIQSLLNKETLIMPNSIFTLTNMVDKTIRVYEKAYIEKFSHD